MRIRFHNSSSARSTADSVSSRPSFSLAWPAVIAPSFSSRVQSSRMSGDTPRPLGPAGELFQSRSPRSEAMKGRTSGCAKKSGCSPAPPSRFKGITLPDAVRPLRISVAVSTAANGGVALLSPATASTKDGAGAGNCACRGRKRLNGCSRSHCFASSAVRIGFCVWRQCSRRAA